MKKSSCGFTDVSMFFGSSGGGLVSIFVGGSARKLKTQKRHTTTSGVDLSISEETRGLRPCPMGETRKKWLTAQSSAFEIIACFLYDSSGMTIIVKRLLRLMF